MELFLGIALIIMVWGIFAPKSYTIKYPTFVCEKCGEPWTPSDILTRNYVCDKCKQDEC